MIRNEKGSFMRGLVYGVGIDDIAGNKEWVVDGKRHTYKYYSDWKNMLKRCYCSKGDYVGNVFVDESWHKLSNFKKWFDKNYIDGYVLDKDILSGKLYSEHTCLYIPSKLNLFITSVRRDCGSYYDKSRNKYQSHTRGIDGKRLNIGRFNTHQEAIFYAKTAKTLEINKLIDKFHLEDSIVVGLYQLLDDMYFEFILPNSSNLGNCTFLDTGGCFKSHDDKYDLSIVKLSNYI